MKLPYGGVGNSVLVAPGGGYVFLWLVGKLVYTRLPSIVGNNIVYDSATIALPVLVLYSYSYIYGPFP